ncbi:hypothetical protein ACFOWX_06410 [Sphingorhabdus arenilitoris]|uniref:Tetratricopeptide repeat protein n=1 Tax=Sphingorhabdus arenilitoris TaxID=1490041 RepID=A0ABV8RHV4_9SPHN
MKSVSKFALAFMIGTLAITPAAYAKKDKKKDEAAKNASSGPQLSPEFRTAYAPAVNPFVDNKFEEAKAAWPAAKAAIKNDDDKYQAGIFAVQLAAKTNDAALRQEGYELLVASNFTPAETKQSIYFELAAAHYDAKDFAAAEPKLIGAYEAGYRKSDIESLIATTLGQQKKYAEATAWIQRGIDAKTAAGQAVPPNYLKQAANYALNMQDNAAINKWMKMLIKVQPDASNWRDALNLYMRSANLNEAQTLDIMRLMRENKAMKYPLEYALYVESIGAIRYPVEVKAVLDEGIAAGNIQQSDPGISDSYKTAASVADEDIRTLASTEAEARASSSGNKIALTADAFFSQGKYATAQSLYELALTKANINDKDGADRTARVTMRLGMAKAKQGDWAGAKATLAGLTDAKRKEMAEYWMIYIDQQMASAAG